MSFKCGLIGLPNVGKSTIFNALTESKIKAENYPFCTINPNIGNVLVPDLRLQQLNKIVNTKKIVPAMIQFVDIAGLVKGASHGEGLGNKFLDNIRQTDAIAHVIRSFEDKSIMHVRNHLDPIEDIKIINTELLLSDIKRIHDVIYQLKKNNKELKKLSFYQKISEFLENEQFAYDLVHEKTEHNIWMKELFLLTNKPIMYINNMNYRENKFKIKDFLKKNDKIINFSLSEFNNNRKLEINKIINTGYDLLKLKTFFTVGPKEIRAWTIPYKYSAFQAAKKIHNDFQKGFIRAEIIHFYDYIKYNGQNGAKKAGKIKLEGKNYIIKDGDIVHFRFNV